MTEYAIKREPHAAHAIGGGGWDLEWIDVAAERHEDVRDLPPGFNYHSGYRDDDNARIVIKDCGATGFCVRLESVATGYVHFGFVASSDQSRHADNWTGRLLASQARRMPLMTSIRERAADFAWCIECDRAITLTEHGIPVAHKRRGKWCRSKWTLPSASLAQDAIAAHCDRLREAADGLLVWWRSDRAGNGDRAGMHPKHVANRVRKIANAISKEKK